MGVDGVSMGSKRPLTAIHTKTHISEMEPNRSLALIQKGSVRTSEITVGSSFISKQETIKPPENHVKSSTFFKKHRDSKSKEDSDRGLS